ncbi:MAG: hypothetical protein LKG20_02190 [Tetrasphaera jenkinsii]|nr:hypothetical protein [Tetrasphaera jenkinsii]
MASAGKSGFTGTYAAGAEVEVDGVLDVAHGLDDDSDVGEAADVADVAEPPESQAASMKEVAANVAAYTATPTLVRQPRAVLTI